MTDDGRQEGAAADGGRRIDVHHHFLPPGYVAAVGDAAIAAPAPAGRVPDWSPEISLAAMDRNGIGRAILSISAPGLYFGDADAALAVARLCNGHAAETCRAHPDRFGFFAATPLPDVDAAIREAGRALDDLGATGVGLMTSYGEHHLGAEPFRPFFDELERRGAVVYVHPTNAPCTCGSGIMATIPAATLDFPFETTRTIVSLLYSGTFARCRNIRWIFSHAGGTLPFLADRIARLARLPKFAAAVPDRPMAELQRLNFDTALSANPRAMRSLMELVEPGRILFGSDYPFAPEATMTASVAGLRALDLAPETLRAIERGNAERLLARPAA